MDAGASYLGVYSLGNPWVCWLIARNVGEQCAERPQDLRFGRVPPWCPSCLHWEHYRRMRLSPGVWQCHCPGCHEEPMFQFFAPRLPRAPNGKVLHRLTEVLETLEEGLHDA